jgi:ribosomal protein S18 acetylase RimI-like enzyme
MPAEFTIAIRRATLADLDSVAPLFDAYRQFYRQPSDLVLARQFLSERLHRGESTILLATTPDRLTAGFAQLYPSFSSGACRRLLILNDLFVAPDFRRAGVGKALLSAAAAEGLKIGAVRLTLSTEATNLPAQALYERNGWQRNSDFYTYNLNLNRERDPA